MDLAYRGGDLSMLVLLPDRKDRLRDLEETLSAGMLQDCIAQMDPREVKPTYRDSRSLGEPMTSRPTTALGMPLAFSRSQADFSGINGHEPPHEDSLFISAVFHKAFVEVNEEGTGSGSHGRGHGFCGPRTSNAPPVPIFGATIPSCSPSAIGGAGRSCFLGG